MLCRSPQTGLALSMLAIVVVHGQGTPRPLKSHEAISLGKVRDPFVEQILQVDPAIYKWYRDTYWENCGAVEARRRTPQSGGTETGGNGPTKNNGSSTADQGTPTNGEQRNHINTPPTRRPPPVTYRPSDTPVRPTRPPYDNGEGTNYRPPINNNNDNQARRPNTQGLSISFPSEADEARSIARQDYLNAQILRQRDNTFDGQRYYRTGNEGYYNGQNQQQQRFVTNNNNRNSYPGNNGGYPNNNYNNNNNFNGQPGQAARVVVSSHRRQDNNVPQVLTLGNGDILIIERGKRDTSYAAERSNVADGSDAISIASSSGGRYESKKTSGKIAKSRCKRADFGLTVVGGVDASSIYPWMVPIVARGTADPYVIWCGASLITDRHLLTAAHCFDIRRDPATFSALIRAHNLSQPEGVIDLAKITIHPDYQPGKFYNDVAIVTLDKPVQNFKPVCLPIEDPIGIDEPAASVEILGYGSLAFGEQASQILQTAALEVFDNDGCRTNYSTKQDTALNRGIIKTHLCAGARDGSKDACQNDSGGPLVGDDPIGRKLLVGVVSFGYQCAREGYPGVYSRVKEFLPWIMPEIRKN